MSDGCDYFLVIEKCRVHEKCREFIYIIHTCSQDYIQK